MVYSEHLLISVSRLYESIKSQAVFFFIDAGDKSSRKVLVSCLIDRAFENRFLHALAEILANLCDSAKPALARRRLGGHVVRDEDQHVYVNVAEKGRSLPCRRGVRARAAALARAARGPAVLSVRAADGEFLPACASGRR